MANYKALSDAVEKLVDNSMEPNVDLVMPLVTQGMNAMKQCKARIQAVRQELLALDA